MRHLLLKWVTNDTPNVIKFQKLCGIQTIKQDKEIKIVKYDFFLNAFFTFCAALGNEMFYILFLPYLFWGVDQYLGRRLIPIWMISYYVGHFLKDILRLPRPPNPPVVQLESHYASEYGMPSTHAMAAIAIPFYILYVTFGRFEYNLIGGFVIAFVWMTGMTLSRLYMGVHSFPDIITGLGLGFLILVIGIYFGKSFDDWVIQPTTNKYAIIFGIALILILIYPRPKIWTNAYGDTVLIIGVFVGVIIGSFALIQSNFYEKVAMNAFKGLQIENFHICILRCLIGYPVLFLNRMITKSVMFNLGEAILGKTNENPGKRYEIEIPTKFVTYTLIGFNSVFTLPCLYYTLNI